MTEVNLLPPELRRRQRSRSMTRQVVAIAAAVILVLLVVFFLESMKLSKVQSDLTAQQAKNAALESQIASLQRFADLQTQLDQKTVLVTDLEQGEVQWSGVMHDLSSVIPSDVFLTNFTGQINIGSDGWETAPDANGLVGTMQFSGTSLNYPNIALWLDRLADVDGWENAWVSNATTNASSQGANGTVPTGTEGVNFTGTVNLGPQATTNGVAP
jgi:Tfp pilus assembly protein PilN